MKNNYNQWHKESYHTDFDKAVSVNSGYYDLIIGELGIGNNKKGCKILDVPSGKGTLLNYLDKKGFGLENYGLDISDYAIKVANKNVRGNFTVGNAEKLPYRSGFFDYIICLGGLEYYANPKKGVSEMARVLKKGGKVFIHVPNLMFLGHIYFAWKDGTMPTEGGGDGKYYNYEAEKFYTYKAWQEIIANNGLKVLRTFKYNDIKGSDRVSQTVNILYRLIKFFIPFNLSYNFIFICEK